MEKVIEVKNLVKKYPKLTAVDSISFDVLKGEVFGLLGENGAGKTTTLEIIEGLRKPTSGLVKILGHDVAKGGNDIKGKIGVQLQSSAYFNFLTLREILELFGGLYPKCLPPEELLEMVDLKSKANAFVGNLSGGQKQRFSIVASLVNDPEIVFLDEPTTGLDPIARRNLWDLIIKIKEKGKTIILTTHYMEEAETLCDRIAIMEKGKLLTIGHTHQLVEHAENPLRIAFIAPTIDTQLFKKLSELGTVKNLLGKKENFEVKLKKQEDLLKALPLIEKLQPLSLTIGRATLEDLFIELTGKTIGE
jgi:ABC-2 type transport system ATP-binding protein